MKPKFIEIDIQNQEATNSFIVKGLHNAFKTAFEKDSLIILKNLKYNDVFISTCLVSNVCLLPNNAFYFNIPFPSNRTQLYYVLDANDKATRL